ncbi:olfactory receptor 2AP1-like [Haliotis cracherodii]|uniref:olfactory receptor 2AP1-like n=1 Tax=Haliotis cracherodii TaxID=6455 RepID=UPI0039EB6FC6
MATTATTTNTSTTSPTTLEDCVLDLSKAELPLILFPTFIFNVVALVVLLKMKGTADSLDRLLVTSLVVNDLISTCLYLLTFLMGLLSCGDILKKPFVCGLMGWLTTTMVMWSAGVITVMTSCRYLALVKPLYHRSKVTSRSIKFALLGTLIYMTLHLIFPFFHLDSPYRMYKSNKICGYDFTPALGGSVHKVILGLISVEGLITIIVVLFFNLSIIKQLRKRAQVQSGDVPGHQTQTRGRQRRTAFATVCIVVSLFFCLCYGPFLGRVLYDVIINAETQDEMRHSVSLSLLFLSPLLNPVLYGIFNKRFRDCFLDLCKNVYRKFRCKGANSADGNPLTLNTVTRNIT